MSAAMIALVAGMAVASGPERIPGEVKQTLDLRGYWEGTWNTILDGKPDTWKARLYPGGLEIETFGQGLAGPCQIVDEGSGKCQVTWYSDRLGIYKWEGDRVIICYDRGNGQRPTAFRGDEKHVLLILKPATPRK